MAKCTTDFDPLYDAANRTGDRIGVSRKLVDALSACYGTTDPHEARQLVHGLGLDGGGPRVTVNRTALFALLVAHARTHHAGTKVSADPSCNCPTCVAARGGGKVIKANPPTTIGAETGRVSAVGTNKAAKPRSTGAVDDLATALKDYLSTDAEKRFALLAKDNGVDPTKYAGRNFGLQRMALGNELRNRWKKGETIRVGNKELKQ